MGKPTLTNRMLHLRLLLFVIIASGSLLIVHSYQTEATTVSVFPSSIKASVGHDFSVSVNVTNVSDLCAWEFKLNWTTTILNVVSVNEGSFLKSGGTTFFAYNVNSTEGHIIVDCTLLGNISGVSGNGVLANVIFNVNNLGQSPLNLYEALLLNSSEQTIPAQISGGQFSSYAHDIAVTAATPVKSIIGQGFRMNIVVTVANYGIYSESFNTTTYANTTVIQRQTVTLLSGGSAQLVFTWNTSGFARGNYIINATASPVPGETDTTDNAVFGGIVKVTIPGDLNGDGKVGTKDLQILGINWLPPLNTIPPGDPRADINGDGKVGTKDLQILSVNWGLGT